MERAAFARARGFLRFKPVATWSALITGVLTAVLFVVLLVLLALFGDLIINRGTIPSHGALPAREQEAFQAWLNERRSAEFQKQAQQRAAELGVPEPLLSLLRKDQATLDAAGKDRQRSLLWMIHLPEILEAQVGSAAAGTVRTQLRTHFHESDPQAAIYRDVPEAGILSLVVRTRSATQGWPASLIARWCSWTWANGNTAYLRGLFLVGLVVGLLRAGMLFLSNYLAAWAAVEATTRLRRSVYHQTYRLGTLAFRALGPTEAVDINGPHIESIYEALYGWLTVIFREPAKFILLLLVALFVNFWLALAFLLFALLVWLFGGQVASYFRRLARGAAEHARHQLALLQESLMMMRLTKIYLMEQFNQNRVERQLRKHAEARLEHYRSDSIYVPIFLFLGLLAALVLLLIAGLIVLQGYVGVTSTMVLVTALVCLYWPVANFLSARRNLKRGRASAQMVFEFLDRQGSVGQMVDAEFLPSLSRVLEFDNVSFNEPGGERKLLRGVSFAIKTGERVSFVGPDELEKHALVYLLPRFLDPASGEIRIDKKNLRWVTLDSLRAQIGMVLQHNLVFNDTVANNIGCGDPAYSLPRVMEAAKVAHAHQFIQKLPQGYETVIGGLGHKLSRGEMFLIALARAILRDPAIVVIEEPPTPLSDDFKALVDDTYSRFLPGRTVLFLPHRLSTIRNCDRVFLLYQGKIEAVGDHRELLAQSDLYRHLQYLEFNEFANLNLAPAPIVPGLGTPGAAS